MEKEVEKRDEQKWYSLGCTSPQKELQVRDDARRYGLEAFVPLTYVIRTHKGQKHRALIPAITQLLFVKGTLDEVRDYIRNAHFIVFIRKSTFSNKEEYLTVPTHEMENFIAVTENHEEHVTYFRPEEISLQTGDRIRIKGGIYDGREGVIMRIKGKRNRHLVVQIPGMLIAAVELSPEMIELSDTPQSESTDSRSLSLSRSTFGRLLPEGRKKSLSKGLSKGLSRSTFGRLLPEERKKGPSMASSSRFREERPSKDVDKDKKLLMEIAERLLNIPDKYQQENEYYLLLSEMRRCRDRLKTFRGYTPATEAELALPN